MRSYSKGSSRCRMQVLLLSYEQLGSLPSYTRVTKVGRFYTYVPVAFSRIRSWNSMSTFTRSSHRPPEEANPAARVRLDGI